VFRLDLMSLGEESEALGERIETLSHPGAKEASQSHTRVTAFGATRATADAQATCQMTH
jgi:hypothetical protein